MLVGLVDIGKVEPKDLQRIAAFVTGFTCPYKVFLFSGIPKVCQRKKTLSPARLEISASLATPGILPPMRLQNSSAMFMLATPGYLAEHPSAEYSTAQQVRKSPGLKAWENVNLRTSRLCDQIQSPDLSKVFRAVSDQVPPQLARSVAIQVVPGRKRACCHCGNLTRFIRDERLSPETLAALGSIALCTAHGQWHGIVQHTDSLQLRLDHADHLVCCASHILL